MKRGLIIVLILVLLFAGLLVVAYYPFSQPQPAIALPALTPDASQMEFLRHFELGSANEAQGLLPEAQSEYAKAALSENEDIARTARLNYPRLVELQQSQLYNTQTYLQGILTPVFWVILIISAVILIILYFPSPSTYAVLSFTDLTKDQNGKALRDLIVRDLVDIQQIYEQAQKSLLLDLKRFQASTSTDQPDSFSDLINVFSGLKVGAVSIPVDLLKNLFENWRNRNQRKLGGTFYQCGDQYYLDAVVSRNGQDLQKWYFPVCQQESASEAIHQLSTDAAYRYLYFMLGEKAGFQTWNSLKTWSEKLHVIQQPSFDAEAWRGALKEFQKLYKAEPQNRLVAYTLGVTSVRLEQYDQARQAFYQMIQFGTPLDDLSLVGTYWLAQTVYLDFEPGGFKEAAHLLEQLKEQSQLKNVNPLEKQINALVNCSLALIWAHTLYDQKVDKLHTIHQLDLVEKTCSEALGLSGDLPEVKAAAGMARGVAYHNLERFEDALTEFSTVLEIQRDYPGALIYQAKVLSEFVKSKIKPGWALGDQVIKAFVEKKIEEKDRLLKEMEEKAQEAVNLLQESIERDLPGQAYAIRKLAELNDKCARIYIKIGKFDLGIQYYYRAVELKPDMANVWENIAYRTLEAQRFDSESLTRAEDAARKAVSLSLGTEQEAHCRGTLAEVLYHLFRYEEAMLEVERALALPHIDDNERQRLNQIQRNIASALPSPKEQ